jgi:hypothetical protein
MEELTGEGGKGKKKGGFSFKNLIGQFSDVGQQGKSKQQPQAQAAAASSAKPSPDEATLNEGERAAVPSRPTTGQGAPSRRFRSDTEMSQSAVDAEKMRFEQVTKPQLDYEHKLRLEEIEKQYGQKLTPRTKVAGSSVPLGTDTTGKPIDPKKPYTVLYNNQNQAVAALEEYERPASSRASGPEAKVESLKKDILAEAQSQGKAINEAEAEIQARTLMLRQARAQLASTLESTRGKKFANKVRADLEKGIMTPATARGVIVYVGTEAKRRFNDDMATIATGKSLAEIEDEIYTELGTTREQVSGYLRQGAKGPSGDEPGSRKAHAFDKDLHAVPSRP